MNLLALLLTVTTVLTANLESIENDCPVVTNITGLIDNTVTNGLASINYVNTAISGIHVGADTNAVRDLSDIQITNHVESGYLARPTVTNGLASVGYVDGATNNVPRITDGTHEIRADGSTLESTIFSQWDPYDGYAYPPFIGNFRYKFVEWTDRYVSEGMPEGWYSTLEKFTEEGWEEITGAACNMRGDWTNRNATRLMFPSYEGMSDDTETSRTVTEVYTRLATTNDLHAVATNAYTKAEADERFASSNSIVKIASGDGVSLGTNSITSGNISIAIGRNAMANRFRAVALGVDTFATNNYSSVIGSSGRSHGDNTFNAQQNIGRWYAGDEKVVDLLQSRLLPSTAIDESGNEYEILTNSGDRVTFLSEHSSISNRQDALEGYIAGQRVRVSVTNYYGNSSGQLPRLRIEEFITATNTVDGVDTETNYWQTVWDEQNKYERFMIEATTAIAAMTNNLYQTYYQLLQERLNTKAPRAWGMLTSAGEAAPAGSVWHTEPNTVFAGGTEYAHAMVGTGVIGVLTTKGAAVYTDGETGRFHFTTDDKTAYFGMNIATRYELGCATDGITVTSVGGNNMVDLLYNVTMSGKPVLYYTPTLQGTITWEQITDSTGGAIPGATVYASWDQAPPAGSEICTINCGQGVNGFFKATIEYAGVSKFETNMMADLAGGIVATNQTSNQMQPVEPYISGGSVLWRVKQ